MAATKSHDVLANNGGEWIVDWLSNEVTVIGPRSDLGSFKKLCIRPGVSKRDQALCYRFSCERVMPTPSGTRGLNRYMWRNDNWGTDREPWNLGIIDASDPYAFVFKFESAAGFPEPIFSIISQRFPTLAFFCVSIEFGESYREIGWFNTPEGCCDFHKEELQWRSCSFEDLPSDPIARIRLERTMGCLKAIARSRDSTTGKTSSPYPKRRLPKQ